jgi:chloramphenicol O-acetyltransferase type A
MAGPVREIDRATWSRAGQYRLFRHYQSPHYAITAPLDVTGLMSELKPQGVSPFIAVLYSIMAGCNRVDAFRTRFRGETVVEHGSVGGSFTVPSKDKGFVFCETPFHDDWAMFNRQCRADIERARAGGHQGESTAGDDGWIFLSCLPWIALSAMTHAFNGTDDCIPRIAWGKIDEPAPSQFTVSVAVQVHHALVDGEHVGQFFEQAQAALDAISPS